MKLSQLIWKQTKRIRKKVTGEFFLIAWWTSSQSWWFMWRTCHNSSTHNWNCSIRSGRISSECKRSHALRVSKPSPTRRSQSLLTAGSDSRAGGRICQGQVVKRTQGDVRVVGSDGKGPLHPFQHRKWLHCGRPLTGRRSSGRRICRSTDGYWAGCWYRWLEASQPCHRPTSSQSNRSFVFSVVPAIFFATRPASIVYLFSWTKRVQIY